MASQGFRSPFSKFHKKLPCQDTCDAAVKITAKKKMSLTPTRGEDLCEGDGAEPLWRATDNTQQRDREGRRPNVGGQRRRGRGDRGGGVWWGVGGKAFEAVAGEGLMRQRSVRRDAPGGPPRSLRLLQLTTAEQGLEPCGQKMKKLSSENSKNIFDPPPPHAQQHRATRNRHPWR